MRISHIQVHSSELSITTHRSSDLSFLVHNHVLITANCIQAQCVFHIPKESITIPQFPKLMTF